MTDYGNPDAWIRISYASDANNLYLNAEDWDYGKSDSNPILLDLPSRGHFGKSFNIEKVTVKIKNTYVTTEADWNILKTQLETAEDAGDAKLRIQVSKNYEVSTVVCIAAADYTSGEYFQFYVSDGDGTETAFFVWFKLDADGAGEPGGGSGTAIEAVITSGETAQDVSDIVTALITAKTNVTATNASGASETVTITNDLMGDVTDTADVDTGMTIDTTTVGGTYELFNGASGKDVMPVLIVDKKGYTKKFNGNTTYYMLKSITLRQMGALE